MDSILESTKLKLGLIKDYEAFDELIIMYINTSITVLEQLGVKTNNLRVTGYEEVWSSLIKPEDNLETVKDYVFLQTRMLFDPPTSSIVMNANDALLKELGWRIEVQCNKNQNEKELIQE